MAFANGSLLALCVRGYVLIFKSASTRSSHGPVLLQRVDLYEYSVLHVDGEHNFHGRVYEVFGRAIA